MRLKIGVMGSAEALPHLQDLAAALAKAIAGADAILITGATTGLIYQIGKAVREAGGMHIGVSPAHDALEHRERYRLPIDACDAIIYTGFGLKGRNVVLVRSSDIVLFVAGSMGSLNEFTIAYDEGKIIGCLTGSGGVADKAKEIVEAFKKPTNARIFYEEDPAKLVEECIKATF